MAREHARILTSIWSDPDFRERTPEAQRLYVLVLSQSSVNNAGVVPLQPKKWARGSTSTTAEDLEQPLRELHDHGYVIVDPDADEALIRSFIRNDGVWRQPNVLKSALRQARGTYSPVLRAALSVELDRVAAMLPAGKGYEGVPEELRRTVAQLSGKDLANPAHNPLRDRPADPPAEGRSDRSVNPSRSRGVGEGVGEGGLSRPVGGWVGGSRASEREAPASSASGGPPTPSSSEAKSAPTPGSLPGFSEQPCGRRHSPDEPCRRCGEARETRAVADERARRDAAAAVSACRMCEGDGRLLEVGRFLPVSPTAWCDHETDHRQQVADARDEAS